VNTLVLVDKLLELGDPSFDAVLPEYAHLLLSYLPNKPHRLQDALWQRLASLLNDRAQRHAEDDPRLLVENERTLQVIVPVVTGSC